MRVSSRQGTKKVEPFDMKAKNIFIFQQILSITCKQNGDIKNIETIFFSLINVFETVQVTKIMSTSQFKRLS